uniref:tRNA pseudouridine(55) synthase n=1 Tax=Hyaloperonospora arabidopsidis (strain Emoy2) TaxID=559515 RepID=M4C197_HYAAE
MHTNYKDRFYPRSHWSPSSQSADPPCHATTFTLARSRGMTPSGFLNVRKPAGLTSHQCVGTIRRALDTQRQVGHGGTLDPMATGVLTVAVGRATRFLQFLTTGKEYRGVIRLGVTTDSDDITGEMLTQHAVPWVTEETVQRALQRYLDKGWGRKEEEVEQEERAIEDRADERLTCCRFIGSIDQVPPRVSAIKRNGVRMYKLARANNERVGRKREFSVTPRRVYIEHIDVEKFTQGDFPEVEIRVDCGGGTYIRSIARECGEALVVPPEQTDSSYELRNPAGDLCAGGTLTKLERTRSGIFTIAGSLSLDEIRAKAEVRALP